jgi:hypothetical protein
MQGAENVLLEQGVMGAFIVILMAAIAVLWVQYHKQGKELRKQSAAREADLCSRNDALTSIIENTIRQELELASKHAEQSREMHTTLTLLASYLKETEKERERARQDHGHSS